MVPSDTKSTRDFCKAHELRHAYFRNMADLDEHRARDETLGWIQFGNEFWLQHAGHGVILAATGPEWLVKNSAAMCEGALLAPDALSIEYKSAQKLLVGVSPPRMMTTPPAAMPAAHAGPGRFLRLPWGKCCPNMGPGTGLVALGKLVFPCLVLHESLSISRGLPPPNPR